MSEEDFKSYCFMAAVCAMYTVLMVAVFPVAVPIPIALLIIGVTTGLVGSDKARRIAGGATFEVVNGEVYLYASGIHLTMLCQELGSSCPVDLREVDPCNALPQEQ